MVFILVVIVLGAGLWFTLTSKKTDKTEPSTKTEIKSPQLENFKVISTKPDPLEGATILPTQEIEITFNREVVRSEIKHKFDPEVEHEITTINGKNSEVSKTFKITFKKPLSLGSGYTLFIYDGTHTENKQNLDKQYSFHFETIAYKGI